MYPRLTEATEAKATETQAAQAKATEAKATETIATEAKAAKPGGAIGAKAAAGLEAAAVDRTGTYPKRNAKAAAADSERYAKPGATETLRACRGCYGGQGQCDNED